MNATNKSRQILADITSVGRYDELLRSRGMGIWIVESVFMLGINATTFFGNLLILIAVYRNPRLRRTIPNMYIITLAVSDFAMSLTGISFSSAATVFGGWPFGEFFCQFEGFFVLLQCAVSLQTLAVTAVNRYFCVTRSRAVYRKYFTMKSTKITIVVLWLLAILAPLPYVAAGELFIFHPGKVFCTHNLNSLMLGYGAYLVLFYVAIPLIVIFFCYLKVFLSVRRHNRAFRIHAADSRPNLTSQQQPQLTVEEINITWTLMAVVLGFSLCWTPVVVIDLLDFANQGWKLPRQAYMAYTCFGYSSTATNAFIYGVMNKSFRAEYAKILPFMKKVNVSLTEQSPNKPEAANGEGRAEQYRNKDEENAQPSNSQVQVPNGLL